MVTWADSDTYDDCASDVSYSESSASEEPPPPQPLYLIFKGKTAHGLSQESHFQRFTPSSAHDRCFGWREWRIENENRRHVHDYPRGDTMDNLWMWMRCDMKDVALSKVFYEGDALPTDKKETLSC